MVNTTIQISNELKQKLNDKKIRDSESYEDVLWDLLEDSMELSKETISEIEQGRKDYKKGKFYTLSQVKKEAGL
ncbi:hypothetical protein IIC68_03085 [archaeon]|nr:hypothetical protein [archaeon]